MSYPWTTHIDHDAFDELDLSNGGRVSGQVGCMVRRLDSLWRREKQLIDELAQIRAARDVAMAELDRFIGQDSGPTGDTVILDSIAQLLNENKFVYIADIAELVRQSGRTVTDG